MDNITHTLVGVALGHALGGKSDTPKRAQNAILLTSIIGSNFPDIDVFLNSFFKNPHLAGLLEHRGYTHSFLAVPFFAILAAGISARIAKTPLTKKMFWIGVIALFLHIAADYFNDYGVHPLSPFFNRWFYGDTLFILEPSLWLVVLPLAYIEAQSIWTKALALAFGFLILGTLWLTPYASHGVALALSVFAGALFWIQNWSKQKYARSLRGAVALTTMGVVVLIFGAGGVLVSREVERSFVVGTRGENLVDLVRTPAPGNPFCWRVLAVSSSGDQYQARLGVLSFLDSKNCFFRLAGPRNAVLRDSTLADTARIHWVGEFSGSLGALNELARTDCQVEALLKFVRVPYWTKDLMADLRYDYGKGGGFTSVKLKSGEGSCLSFVPPWIPPFALFASTHSK